MQEFSSLYEKLEQAKSSSQKVFYLSEYFAISDEDNSLVALNFLLNKTQKKVISKIELEKIAREEINHSDWLFEVTSNMIVDIAETVALLLPKSNIEAKFTLSEIVDQSNIIQQLKADEKHKRIKQVWDSLNTNEKFLFNKMLLGSLRFNLVQREVTDALSASFKVDKFQVIYNLSQPSQNAKSIGDYLSKNKQLVANLKPYPFKSTLEKKIDISTLKEPHLYCIEEFWEGIRCQLIKKKGRWMLWTNEYELLNKKVPELSDSFDKLPDEVIIEGVLISILNGKPAKSSFLRNRIKKKNISRKFLKELPFTFVVYDLLYQSKKDLRLKSLKYRKEQLDDIMNDNQSEHLTSANYINCNSWEDIQKLRRDVRVNNAQGVLLKRLDSKYSNDKLKLDWILVPAKRYDIKAVLLYITYGSGTGQFGFDIECTFAVNGHDKLISIVKTSVGLTQENKKQIDTFVKKNTVERFGPVRTIRPEKVFRVSFADIYESKRHKSGLVLKDPVIEEELENNTIEDIDTIQYLLKKLEN